MIISLLKLLKKKIFAIRQPAIRSLVRLLVFSTSFFIYLNIYGQVDPKKVDSLSKWIDSAAYASKVQQDSFIQHQDSTYRLGVNASLQQSSQNANDALVEQKRREKQRQEIMIRILLGVLILLIAIVTLVRKRKTKP